MNRFFAITGFLAAGMACFLVQAFIVTPWALGRPHASALIWCAWGGIILLGIGIIFPFIRYSFLAHWASLRHNAPMPRSAWRGVGIIYLVETILFEISAVAMYRSESHHNESYLYIALTALCLMLTAVAFRQGFRRHT